MNSKMGFVKSAQTASIDYSLLQRGILSGYPGKILKRSQGLEYSKDVIREVGAVQAIEIRSLALTSFSYLPLCRIKLLQSSRNEKSQLLAGISILGGVGGKAALFLAP